MVKKLVRIFLVAIIFIIVILIFCFRPSSISDSESIILVVEPTESDSLHISVTNKTQFEANYSNEYHIEKHSFLGWHRISIKPVAFTSLGYSVGPNKATSIVINYNSIYGSLPSGQYRLVKEFTVGGENIRVAGYFDLP